MLKLYYIWRLLMNTFEGQGRSMKRLTDDEFDALVYEYSQVLFKVAYSYTKNITDSEDIVQEVFMKLYNIKMILIII